MLSAMSDPVSRDRRGGFVDFLHDLGHAWRVARNRPGFALAVVLTLALGIGANTAVFSVIHAVVLSPLPYEESDGLYTPLEQHTSGRQRGLSYPTFQDWQQQADVFEGLAYARGAPVVYQTQEHSGLLVAAFVTDDFFELLGVEAEVGRGLSEDDYQAGAPGALVLSRRAWRRWFGSDPNIIGQTITVDEIPLSVVGISLQAGDYGDAGGAFVLYLTNLAGIVLAAMAVFFLTGFVPVRHLRRMFSRIQLGFIIALFAVLVISVPLIYNSRLLLSGALDEGVVRQEIDDWLGDETTLELVALDVSGDRVDLDLLGPEPPPPATALRNELADALGEDVTVQVGWIENVEQLSAPEP